MDADNETTTTTSSLAVDASIRVPDEVIASIAGLAALEEPGVAALTTTLVGGLTERLGRKHSSKGVRLEIRDRRASFELHLLVEFGQRIPDLAGRVQNRVKRVVEHMTPIAVDTVNVHIQGIVFGESSADRE